MKKNLRLNLRCIGIRLNLLECNECGSADIIALQHFDALFGRINLIDDDVIQTAAACRYGHIISFIDATQVTLKNEARETKHISNWF